MAEKKQAGSLPDTTTNPLDPALEKSVERVEIVVPTAAERKAQERTVGEATDTTAAIAVENINGTVKVSW